jgi:hypothetical protein
VTERISELPLMMRLSKARFAIFQSKKRSFQNLALFLAERARQEFPNKLLFSKDINFVSSFQDAKRRKLLPSPL